MMLEVIAAEVEATDQRSDSACTTPRAVVIGKIIIAVAVRQVSAKDK